MPDERAAFLDALRRQPDDLVLPLVFADWLEEHGEADLAGFVRLQSQCAALVPGDESEAARSLRSREHEAVRVRADALDRGLGLPESRMEALDCGFSRGFLASLSIPVQWLLEVAETLANEAPLLRKLSVGRVNGWGERLAALPLLRRVTELEVEAWIAPADARAIAASRNLRQLRSLEVWLGNNEGGDDETLAAFAGSVARAYPDLEELRLIGVPGCSPGTVARANRLAGRPIAHAVIPLPRLYPIEANFHLWLFAGHLPDGTQVFAGAPRDGESNARLFLFTPAGQQTEIREVPLPRECCRLPEDERGWEHTDRVKEYLRREMGFAPGLIRILSIADPTGSHSIQPYINFRVEESVGIPDDPTVRPEDDGDNAMGNASDVSYWLKHGAYVFWCGNDWWVGPDGTVEST